MWLNWMGERELMGEGERGMSQLYHGSWLGLIETSKKSRNKESVSLIIIKVNTRQKLWNFEIA